MPKHGVQMEWGNNEGVGGGWGVCLGGGERKRHTQQTSEQTTKKWVVGETREKIDEVEDGRERQPSSQRVLLTL